MTNANISLIFQHSLVDINFLARTVCCTFLEMFFQPEYHVGGFVSIFKNF